MSMRVRRIADLLAADPATVDWWPGEHGFEKAIGAILTQNTRWPNVELAIAAMRRADLLTPAAVRDVDPARLQAAIRPAGFFRQKAVKLKTLAVWWLGALGDDPDARPDGPTSDLRETLLALKGIGPETADSILAYAFEREAFVVDAYTARIASRLGLLAPPFGYDELQDAFTSALPKDGDLYRRLHAGLVRHAQAFCTARAPRCAACPLAEGCGGPQDQAG